MKGLQGFVYYLNPDADQFGPCDRTLSLYIHSLS